VGPDFDCVLGGFEIEAEGVGKIRVALGVGKVRGSGVGAVEVLVGEVVDGGAVVGGMGLGELVLGELVLDVRCWWAVEVVVGEMAVGEAKVARVSGCHSHHS